MIQKLTRKVGIIEKYERAARDFHFTNSTRCGLGACNTKRLGRRFVDDSTWIVQTKRYLFGSTRASASLHQADPNLTVRKCNLSRSPTLPMVMLVGVANTRADPEVGRLRRDTAVVSC
jgi:hypothetical protein